MKIRLRLRKVMEIGIFLVLLAGSLRYYMSGSTSGFFFGTTLVLLASFVKAAEG